MGTERFIAAVAARIGSSLLLPLLLAACGGGGQQEVDTPLGMSKAMAVGGPVNLSALSRANCVNNESITWDKEWVRNWWMAVESTQTSANGHVVVEVCDVYGKRCGAVKWLAGLPPGSDWLVEGTHYISYDDAYQRDYLRGWCTRGWLDTGPGSHWNSGVCKSTEATSCNTNDW